MTVAPAPGLRVGLIGCGRIAQWVHLPILTRLPGVELTALAEPDPERRSAAAARAPGAVAVADYRELLASPRVAAVVICLPSGLHGHAAIAALEAGKHVYLEKPVATDLAEGARVVAARRRAGTVGMIGFNYRFNRLYAELRRRIHSGDVGEPVGARSVFATVVRPLPAWKHTRQGGGGALLDLASHHIDLVRFLFEEEVESVFATLRSQRVEDDSATLGLRLTGGLLVQSFFSLCAIDEDRFEVYGHRGKLAVDKYASTTVEFVAANRRGARVQRLAHGLRSVAHGPYLLEKLRAPGNEPSYAAALQRFVTAAQAGRPDLGTPDMLDGYRSLAVVAAAEEAARSGRVVTLPPTLDAGGAGGAEQDDG